MKPTIPLYKAEKMDSDEEIVGDLIAGKFIAEHPVSYIENFDTNCGQSRYTDEYFCIDDVEEIKPETLRISFDGGENWYKIDRADQLICMGEYYELAMSCRQSLSDKG